MAIQLVWLKRDLRLDDHEPFVRAAAAGPVLALYVFEPELLAADESDRGQWGFVLDSLRELDADLRARGARLVVRRGALPDVFAALQQDLAAAGGIAHVHAHEETGSAVTFARDRRVAAFWRERGVPFTEHAQTGVIRRLRSRDGWSRKWEQRMRRPRLEAPAQIVDATRLVPGFDPGALPTLDGLDLPPTTIVDRQPGGSAAAHDLLRTFLHERGEDYRRAMSSPLTGRDACSRLSPHLAHGTISLRTVFQNVQQRAAELRALPAAARGTWLQALQSFGGRLRWHCHFVQKLEDEPALEFDNLHRGYDGLREGDFDAERFAAWAEGRTGHPMVDACMRSLRHTGWLNFRMRAMLVSFAAYHLWQHWRPVGLHLARCFVDFEPGIHWSQVQMQSGTTGINAVRIYSPQKQLRDQDPDGTFVRRWLPELQHVPLVHLAEPHRMTAAEQAAARCRIGVDYPAPIVDAKTAVADAKARIFAVRRSAAARRENQRVYAQHGSRKRPRRRAKQAP